ncbi:MAG: hypothetical protein ABI042_05700 [Verrucomicrobiota bacterium]
MPNHLVIFLCAALLPARLLAAPEFVTTQSLSKQFVIYGPKENPGATRAKLFPLTPTFLAVSCERIKQSVLAELGGAVKGWPVEQQKYSGGKIYLVLHPNLRQQPLITPLRTSGKLSYRIDLPNQIEGAALIEAVTEAILMEIANRRSTEKLAQVPRWLSQGIAAQVKENSPETLLLQANQPYNLLILSDRHSSREKNRNAKVLADPVSRIRQNLANFTPLTFEELSRPETLPPERARHFEECAHLFLVELQRLKQPEHGLRQILDELPQDTEWQTTFLRIYRAQFQQSADVEKWWSLQVFGRSNFSSVWSHEQSLENLAMTLAPSLQVPGNADKRENVPVQEIISHWPVEQQKIAMPRMMMQLRLLRLRMEPSLVFIVDEYCAVLENYLKKEDKNRLIQRVLFRPNLQDLKKETKETLDALDRRRAAAYQPPKPKPSSRDDAVLSALKISSPRLPAGNQK